MWDSRIFPGDSLISGQDNIVPAQFLGGETFCSAVIGVKRQLRGGNMVSNLFLPVT